MSERTMDDAAPQARRLYDRYGASLYRYALMLVGNAEAAEDAVQQVFTSLLRAASPPALDNEAHYLRRAVRNQCYSMLRRRRLEEIQNISPLLEPVDQSFTSLDERLALECALRALPIEQRELVHLHVFEGLTFREIAEAADESINTVSSRYRSALGKLRALLDGPVAGARAAEGE